MLYPSIDLLRTKVDSRYTLCSLASKRARDLIDGKPSILGDPVERPVSIATDEIANDLISYTRSAEDSKSLHEEAYLEEETEMVQDDLQMTEEESPESEALQDETAEMPEDGLVPDLEETIEEEIVSTDILMPEDSAAAETETSSELEEPVLEQE